MGNTIEITLDLPMPPSVNRMWRRGKRGMYVNPVVTAWQKQADLEALCAGKKPPKITGAFDITISLKRTRGDIDNRIKAILDWLQSREYIANDKYCRSLTARWVNDGPPCRIILSAHA